MKRLSWSLLALFASVSPVLAQIGSGPLPSTTPALSITGPNVVANGFTPGGQVVMFGLSREVDKDFSATLVRRSKVLLASPTGSVQLVLPHDVALRSVFVGVDIQTGKSAATTPTGFELHEATWRQSFDGWIRNGPTGSTPDWVADSRCFFELLLVRPGVGAWVVSAGDGGPNDVEGAYGRVIVPIDKLVYIAPDATAGTGVSVPTPTHFLATDVTVLIDPNSMELVRANGGVALPGV